MEEANERRLIEAAQRDPRRFADLYEQNFDRVYAYIIRRVRNRDEAEDLTSEVFHHALDHLANFEWRGIPFAAWLFRIAANAIADRRREAARETGNPAAEELDERSMKEIEQQASFFQLVRSLPEDQRRVIVLHFAEQRSFREIARELERTEGAVKQLQVRALENLRRKVEGRL